MTYEEKYKQALEIAKEEFRACGDLDCDAARQIFRLFPELKEDEDEIIREEIIAYMRYERKSTEEKIENRFIPWLEKQCKQKTNEIHPIFRVGDYIRNKKTCDKVLIEQLDVKSKAYCYTSYDGAAVIHSDFPFSRQDEWELIGQKVVEKNHTDKVEPKFKVGDTIVEKDLDEYDYETIKDIKDGRYIFTDGYGMNIDEQEGWKLVKTPKIIEQNPTWSEEDKKKIELLIAIFEVNHPNEYFKVNPINTLNMEAMSTEEIVDWLKSIKERIKGE